MPFFKFVLHFVVESSMMVSFTKLLPGLETTPISGYVNCESFMGFCAGSYLVPFKMAYFKF